MPHDEFAAVPGLANVAQVVMSGSHVCARLAAGGVTCWGEARLIGTPNLRGAQQTPLAVAGLRDVTDLSAGIESTCARLKSGAVKCWGHYGMVMPDDRGEMGLSDEPVEVRWLAGSKMISLGLQHGCTILSDGDLACWGDNSDGQLGDGTMDARRHARRVVS